MGSMVTTRRAAATASHFSEPLTTRAEDIQVADSRPSLRWRLFSPISKLHWLPYQSKLIGASCFLYGVPFVWGAWPLYLAQVVCSLMSDYWYTGRDSYWHPIDRTLATLNSAYVIGNGFLVIPWWQVILLVIGTFSCYGLSLHFMKRKHMDGYRIAHTLWHLAGSASISYLMASACGPSILSERCERKVVGTLYCNCIGTSTNATL